MTTRPLASPTEPADAAASDVTAVGSPGSAAAVLLLCVAPGCAVRVPARHCSAKYLCCAIVAVGIGLAWGHGGMLVLGQGVFFGLGGYAMAMHLKLDGRRPGQRARLHGAVRRRRRCRAGGSRSARRSFALSPIVAAARRSSPSSSASLVFRRRVKGAYFAILTQALAVAFAILLIGQQTTDRRHQRPEQLHDLLRPQPVRPADQAEPVPHRRRGLLIVLGDRLAARTAAATASCWSPSATARSGSASSATTRPTSSSSRSWSRPCMASIAGALFVPIVGIISPANVGVVPSIASSSASRSAAGPRCSGPVLGAIVVG